jgi:hypothetical protein
MSVFSGLTGLLKLGSNFLGGGAGDSSSVNQNSTTNSTTKTDNSQQTQQSTRLFSDGFLQILEKISADALGSSAQSQSAIRDQIDNVSKANLGKAEIPFDMQGYIDGIVKQATSKTNNQLESDINSTESAIGGSSSGNSMSALLAGKLRNNAAADIAGITANATGTGAQIKSGLAESRANLLSSGSTQLAGLGNSVDSTLANLLTALKGGEQFQETGTKESNTSTTVGSGTLGQQTSTPFNWAKGFGNIFTGLGQD